MKTAVFTQLLFFYSILSFAQFETNYNESKVPEFEVPEVLTTFNNEKITTSQEWIEKRRPELYNFFENKVFGKVPGDLDTITFKVIETDENALDGRAMRKQVKVTLFKNEKSLSFNLLIYLPKTTTEAPVFLGYNFYGNHSITADSNVIVSDAWAMNSPNLSVSDHQLTESSRGKRAYRWAIDKIIAGGFGLATIYYGEIDPDKHDFTDGIHPLFYTNNQEKPETHQWGSLAAWSFGLSRAMDYFEQDEHINAKQVIVFGHSRLGKTSLWAGANDERFAGVISNNSGCGGAALSKRKFGETINVINTSFPHWFSRYFKNYNNNEEALPVDQHELLALIAPRPLYIASAQGDQWADPKGEYLSAYYASEVYALFGKEGIASKQLPPPNNPVHKAVSYHIRTGKHDVTDYDWEQYIIWANNFLY